MANYELGPWWVVAVTISVTMMISNLGYEVGAEPQVPCYFIFGDSLVDNGNNNGMSSLARANYLPYGIDYPGGPSGRFTNGKTTVDVIAEQLGFDRPIPPYMTARGQQIRQGLNYASAAAGIRDETGRQLGERISMNGQVKNYQKTVSQLAEMMGGQDAAKAYLSKCVFTLGLGSNDYLNNYFMPVFYNSGQLFTPQQFADSLIHDYSQQITTLYNYGARKVALVGVGQIGCSPNELARKSSDGRTCARDINSANEIFNGRLKSLVDHLNSQHPDANFTYINVYNMFKDIIANPSSYGFRVTNSGCCGVGRNNGQITCLPFQTPCQNRHEHVFWDAYHPTEASNTIIGRRSYAAKSPADAYPVDIRGLAQL